METNVSVPVVMKCRPASFGDQSTDDESTGVGPYKRLMSKGPAAMILADPIDACVEPKEEQAQYREKVVFVLRGKCPFYKKALNVMKGSQGTAAAIIIADNAPNPNGLITLVRGTTPAEQKRRHKIEAYFSIPTVSLLYEDGQKVLEMFGEGNDKMRIGMNVPKGWKDLEQEGLLKEHPDESNPAYWHNLAVALANQGSRRRAEAIKVLNRTVTEGSYDSMYLLAELYEQEGEYMNCHHTWKKAARLADDGATRMKCMEKSKEAYDKTFEGSEKKQVALKKSMLATDEDMKAKIAEIDGREHYVACGEGANDKNTTSEASGACTCKPTSKTGWLGGLTGWTEAKIGAKPDKRKDVCCVTSKGAITISVQPALAPLGAARFLDMVRGDFFTGMPFYGTTGKNAKTPADLEATYVRFGIPAEPKMRGEWKTRIPDDPNIGLGFERGSISFRANTHAKNDRDFKLAIATGKGLHDGWPFDNIVSQMMGSKATDDTETMPFAVPFGRITHGLEILDELYHSFNSVDERIQMQKGSAQATAAHPKMDWLRSCSVIGE
jgi:cyclophilin family peptidyl-prolyl cis-trans isomerase